MPDKKKETVGRKFIKLLDDASKDRNLLLNLACAVIKNSPSKRSFSARKLPDDATAIKMNASIARFQALGGKDVSTDGMLMLIMDTYRKQEFGNPEKFKKDFENKFPVEYGKSIDIKQIKIQEVRQIKQINY